MEPRPHGRRRQVLLATVAAAALTAATTLPGRVHAFVVPAPTCTQSSLPRTALQHGRLATRARRGLLWASTTQESEPQQQAATTEGSLASPSSSLASSAAAAEAAAGKGFGAAPRAKTGTVNKRLLNVIDAELKTVQDGKGPQAPANAEDDTDLNGINPIQPLGSAMFAGLVSFLFWRITIGLATALNNVQLETDWYPVQRMFSVASTAFVGITALGAGVIGVTALGLLGLAARVTLGIATGELDPNKVKEAPPTPPVPLDAQGLPKITGAWYDVPKQPKKKEEGGDKAPK